MLDITSDIQSLTTFRRSSGDFMKQLKKTKRPVVLTVNGKAAAVVQDAEAYQRLLDIAARADANEGIRQGLDDVAHRPHPAGKGVFRRVRSQTWHTSLTSLPALSEILPVCTTKFTPGSPTQRSNGTGASKKLFSASKNSRTVAPLPLKSVSSVTFSTAASLTSIA
jgi:prevent-host-death family protein